MRGKRETNFGKMTTKMTSITTESGGNVGVSGGATVAHGSIRGLTARAALNSHYFGAHLHELTSTYIQGSSPWADLSRHSGAHFHRPTLDGQVATRNDKTLLIRLLSVGE
ncbi:hypothetical protein L484_015942 [Morus notabilis]|uniref:Uncharacterized protein n=1 Tax=Morus notabilis TaxID=981085 RepID=W9QNQ6_9ROSA|nr:hypothetical protein L484_015942 [Morus notabilis]